jgi:hypothetical protein
MTGATTGVLAVSLVVRKVFRVNHPAVPLVASLAISFAVAVANSQLGDVLGWVVAIVNGCLIFFAVVGVNESAADFSTPRSGGKGMQQGGLPMPWLKSFFDR